MLEPNAVTQHTRYHVARRQLSRWPWSKYHRIRAGRYLRLKVKGIEGNVGPREIASIARHILRFFFFYLSSSPFLRRSPFLLRSISIFRLFATPDLSRPRSPIFFLQSPSPRFFPALASFPVCACTHLYTYTYIYNAIYIYLYIYIYVSCRILFSLPPRQLVWFRFDGMLRS